MVLRTGKHIIDVLECMLLIQIQPIPSKNDYSFIIISSQHTYRDVIGLILRPRKTILQSSLLQEKHTVQFMTIRMSYLRPTQSQKQQGRMKISTEQKSRRNFTLLFFIYSVTSISGKDTFNISVLIFIM